MSIAKVEQLIEPSISPEQFMYEIMSNEQNTEMLMHKTVKRILDAFNTILSIEDYRPDFAQCIELVSELFSYGFKAEAKQCLDALGFHLEEFEPGLLAWYRLNAKMFEFYTIPERLRFTKEAPLFRNTEIYIETFHDTKGIMYFTFCNKGCENNEDTDWKDAAASIQDLIEFAVKEDLISGIVDSYDHEGNHTQKDFTTPVKIYIQEHTERIIKEYVRSGEDFVIL